MSSRIPLLEATRALSLSRIKQLIQDGALVDEGDDNGINALWIAISSHNLQVTRLLVERGASVHYRKPNETRNILTLAIDDAAQSGDTSILTYILDRGVDVNEVVFTFTYATSKGNISYSYKLVPLNYSCQFANLDIIRCLVERGADVTAVDEEGKSCLHIHQSTADVVEYLLLHGADVNSRNRKRWNETPLHIHCRNLSDANKKEVIECMLRHDADINAMDNAGENALVWGMRNLLHHGVVTTLVERGINLQCVDYDGCTCLHYAAEYTRGPDLIRYLVQHGADVHVKDKSGRTPLVFTLKSCIVSALDNVRCLIELGSHVNAQSNDGETALLLVCQNINLCSRFFREPHAEDFMTLGKQLLTYGAHVNARSSFGSTALNEVVEAYQKCAKHFPDWRDIVEHRRSEIYGFFSALIKKGSHVDIPDMNNKSVLDYMNQNMHDHDNVLMREYVREHCMPLRLSCLAACIIGRHYGAGVTRLLHEDLPKSSQELIMLHAPCVKSRYGC